MFDIKEEMVQNKNLVFLAKRRVLNTKSLSGAKQKEGATAFQFLFAVEIKESMGIYHLLTSGQQVTTRNNGLWDSDYVFVAKGMDIEKVLRKNSSRYGILMGSEHISPISELVKKLNTNSSVHSRLLTVVEKKLTLSMIVDAQLSSIRTPKKAQEQGMGLD